MGGERRPRVLTFLAAFGLLLGGTRLGADSLPAWKVVGPAPDRYNVQADTGEAHSGTRSASIRSSTEDEETFAGLAQTFRADAYRGKRLRLSAYLRSAGVELWAGMWMRVDGSRLSPLALDNMHNRPVSGSTPWTRYDVVLDISEEATQIAFGIMLAGKGQVWVDDFTFEVVGAETDTTDLKTEPVPRSGTPMAEVASRPRNLGFEE